MDHFTLAADGLLLRPFEESDAPEVLRALRDPDVAAWSPADQQPPRLADAQQWVAQRANWSSEDHVSFAVVLADSGVLAGSVSLFKLDRLNSCADIGYWVMPEARGRGIAATSTAAVTRWALSAGRIFRVQLFHAVDNPASCRVATRAGFALEGTLRSSYRYGDGALHDEHLHSR
ncbi:MAG TPA: GNAT family N-acetyltransferase, partial [Asanoa sp.]